MIDNNDDFKHAITIKVIHLLEELGLETTVIEDNYESHVDLSIKNANFKVCIYIDYNDNRPHDYRYFIQKHIARPGSFDSVHWNTLDLKRKILQILKQHEKSDLDY